MRLRNAGWSASVLLIVLVCGALPAQTTHPLGDGDPTTSGFITYNGIPTIRGWRFLVNAPGVTVTELGCRYPDSTTVAKTITLWSVPAAPAVPTALGSATITPGAGWRWAPLTTPIPLTQSAEYVVSAYSSAQMYENNSVPTPSPWKPVGAIQYINLQWQNNPSAVTNFPSGNFGANSQQGVVDIGYVTGPQLSVSANAGTAQSVFNNAQGPGGNGLPVGTFTVTSNSQAGAVLNSITLAASGSGNDQTAFSHVSIWRDANATTAFEPGGDTLIGTAATAFPANDGTLTFNVQAGEQNFGTTESRRYFVVVRLAGTATPGDAFNFRVSDIAVSGTNTTKSGVPSGVMNGLVINAPVFTFTDASAAAPLTAFLNSGGNVCQEFTLAYPAGPDNKPATISVSGTGTGNELAHVTGVALWHDSNASGDFESAADTLVHSGVFNADNGSVSFSMASQPDFQAAQTRTYFVVYAFNLAPLHNHTFKCYVSGAAGAQFGATYAGLPAPAAAGTPGIVISAVVLTATLNGPGAAVAVPNLGAGSTGDGHLLCDVTLQAREGAPWNLGGLTFAAAGTAPHDAAYSELALYEDTGNGVWDGAGGDGAAAGTLAGFGAGPGFEATFVLSNDLLPASGTRRFFLVGTLDGGATSGQTLNARFVGITGAPPVGGMQMGMPTADSAALVIAPAALTAAGRPGGAPPPAVYKSGTAVTVLMAGFRFSASNDDVSLSSFTLTTSGTGNWSTAVEAANGLEALLDNGNGAFDPVGDTMLTQQGGAPTVQLNTPGVVVPNNGFIDIWVVANFTATAGAGSVTPQAFSLQIAQATDVAAAAPVVLGMTPPHGRIVQIADLAVTSFDPASATPAGGQPITITGTGFMSPFSATIGGLVCPGTAVVAAGQVTGLTVPAGTGSNLPIVIVSGGLPAQTLTQTFSYATPGGGSGGTTAGGGGCSAAAAGLPLAWLWLPLLARRRRRA